MNVVLFLYPITPYIRSSLGYCDYDQVVGDKQVALLNELIRKRYRDKGYKIAWLMFTQKDDPKEIDWSIVDARIEIDQANDLLVLAGVPFSVEKGTSRDELARYGASSAVDGWMNPDNNFIFGQLPKDMTYLRLGGFHFSDCVSKAGRFAYKKWGLKGNVLVDEDLTDRFWFRARVYVDGKNPSYRSKRPINQLVIDREMTYKGFGYSRQRGWRRDLPWKRIRWMRNLQPWFVHK